MSKKWRWGVSLSGALLVVLGVCYWPRADRVLSEIERSGGEVDADFVVDSVMERRIVVFCTACHAMPAPDSFSRGSWHDEVMQGYHFYAKSGRSDLDPPPPAAAITYFRRLASQELSIPSTSDAARSFAVEFREEQFQLEPATPVPSAVASLKWIPPLGDQGGRLIAADMRLGLIHELTVQPGHLARIEMGRFGHPCHVETCDLDGNGKPDYLIADLGSFDPDDHDRGRVLWDAGKSDGKQMPVILASRMGRIADVRPADFDDDGDLDLVVAEFGWQLTGGIHVLWNTGLMDGVPRFNRQRIYSRSGTIHVPAFDFDGDQRLDVVALVSQEHERLELLLNRGSESWEIKTLWSAPDPAFGMSGLELVDLDRDGDCDILVTNGDTFDSQSIKPSHGIQWLRNDGSLKFTYQRIANLSGAYRAVPADFDGDGDLDIAVSVWLPRQSLSVGVNTSTMPSLVVFEQTGPMAFDRHTLTAGRPFFATTEVGDFDGDGDPDLAVGWLLSSVNQTPNWISIWWNHGSRVQNEGNRL